jgi:hypothetical protein
MIEISEHWCFRRFSWIQRPINPRGSPGAENEAFLKSANGLWYRRSLRNEQLWKLGGNPLWNSKRNWTGGYEKPSEMLRVKANWAKSQIGNDRRSQENPRESPAVRSTACKPFTDSSSYEIRTLHSVATSLAQRNTTWRAMPWFESLKYVGIKVAQPIFSLSPQVYVGALAAPHVEEEQGLWAPPIRKEESDAHGDSNDESSLRSWGLLSKLFVHT